MTLRCFKHTTEVEGHNTCSLSLFVSLPPPLNHPKSPVTSTPTSPSSHLLSVPSAHAKKIKILQFLTLVVYSNHERFASTATSRETKSATKPVARFVRPRSLRGFLRRQNPCFFTEKSPALQSAQIAGFSQQLGAAGRQKCRAIQLEKLFGGRRCLNGLLRENSGDRG